MKLSLLKKIIDSQLEADPSCENLEVVIVTQDSNENNVCQETIELKDACCGIGLTNNKFILYPVIPLKKIGNSHKIRTSND